MQLHTEEEYDGCYLRSPLPAVEATDLEAMFPNLDAALVKALSAEAATPQQALETLLKLAASMQSPAATAEPARDVGLESAELFPALLDTDGWQIASTDMLQPALTETTPSISWSERAKAAAAKPAPILTRQCHTRSHKLQRAPMGKQARDVDDVLLEIETDYDCRQRMGKQRMENRLRFARKTRAVAQGSLQGSGSCSNDDTTSFATLADGSDSAADVI